MWGETISDKQRIDLSLGKTLFGDSENGKAWSMLFELDKHGRGMCDV